MPSRSNRRTLLLDGAAAVGLSGPVLLAVHSAYERPAAVAWSLTLVIVAAVGAWIVWRHMPRLERGAAVVFALCAVGILITGDGPLAFGAAWVAYLVLARSFAGLVVLGYTVGLCLVVIALHVSARHSSEIILIETAGTAVLAGFGAAFALVLADGDRVEREREEASTAREAALSQLALAHAELQRRVGTEQDLVLAQERERTSRELHDGLGHRLTAMGLSLEFVERVWDREPERARQEIARTRATVAEALDSMRRLVRAMHPIELGTARGVGAFAAIADAFRSTGLRITVDVDGEDDLSHEHSLLLVRFVQEGLTNVVRHADATSVRVFIRGSRGGVEASIEDVGTRPAVSTTDGFGLRSLRGRAETLGGSVETGATSRGFRIRMTLPAVPSGRTDSRFDPRRSGDATPVALVVA